MRKLLLIAVVWLGGCSGCDEDPVVPIDVAPDIGETICNPLTQAGCGATEKCTWLLDAVMPQYVAHIGCAPDGAANVGDACMYGAPGASGYDNCKKGAVCGNYRGGAGVCKQICDQMGGQPACDAQHVCVTYAGLFDNGASTPPSGGVCDLACDPMADNDFDGSGPQTKTGTTCGSNAMAGCYGYPSGGTPPQTGWSCGADINFDVAQPVGLRHRVQCTDTNMCADPGPTIYVNSCNQGYLPLLRESTTVSTAVCTALCKPQNCYGNGNCGSQNVNRIGVSTAGDTNGCKTPDRVGTFTANATIGMVDTGGEHCRYIWSFEIDDQGNFLQSATSNTIGFCFDHSKYLYDSNADNMPDKGLPNCGLLNTAGFSQSMDATMPYTYFGAADLGCVDTTTAGIMAQGKAALPEIATRKRAAVDLPRPLFNKTMGQR